MDLAHRDSNESFTAILGRKPAADAIGMLRGMRIGNKRLNRPKKP
ncbi:hypothetical protein EIO_1573 [Ketogulonicigenium vulgare Y25]|uniref:Uncharacterized protein n=1 Tax=Ketogulonicigenium vulgare (strain WSH-001) TaxID=759362 RepID=F9Y6E6_KETVW|nr:hypothetical protein EIO_1573 [Ketogulonicigenium vulgare Y25]AEM40892.1 hypothetical protein KVU_1053 [Ketogulonicigenium vulgare WSH-001]ALJ82318.1 hypothetical protein KVH_07560 [Ketogulonicigenium vulgare]AOZ54608.1 hypothetical protein KVC_1594 [Ketogulonicigenium vulgare]